MSGLIEIFMIDDHPVYIDGISEAFYKSTKGKFCVSGSAKTIQEAREKIKKTYAEIILLDLKLPGESGVDFCAELKRTYPDKKVIALTGETDNTTLLNTWVNKADAIVMKYTGINELIGVIKTVRAGKRVIGKDVPIVFDTLNPLKEKNLPYLSPREQQVLKLLMSGYSRSETAEKLFIAAETVNAHCKKMFAKFKVNKLQALIKEVEQINKP